MINLMFTGFFNNGIVTIILLLIIFSIIALIASWLRKLIWPSTIEDAKVDPKKAVKEELDRVLVPLAEPLTENKNPTNKTKSTTTKTKSVGKKNASNRKKSSS